MTFVVERDTPKKKKMLSVNFKNLSSRKRKENRLDIHINKENSYLSGIPRK